MSRIVDRLVAAMNAHDLEGAAALFHPQYRSEQPVHPGRSFTGRAQMHANWQAMFAGIPDFHAEILRSADDGNTTWSEWRWTGNRTDGQRFQARGVTLFEITDGQITAGRLYMENVETEDESIASAVQSLSGQTPARPQD